MQWLRIAILRTVIIAAMLSLAACGASGSTGGSPATVAPSHRANVTVPVGDTSLCNIIPISEFSQAVGGGVTKLNKSSVKGPAGTVQVNCSYMPPNMPGAGGAIDFAITTNGQAYYTQVQQEEQSQLNSVHTLSGVGDAAFWGTDNTSPDILNLDMVKDNVVVGITMDGSATDGSAYLPGAEQIAKEVASQL